jgi:hypothetical protein
MARAVSASPYSCSRWWLWFPDVQLRIDIAGRASKSVGRKHGEKRPRDLGHGGMKRFLIFAVLFPPLALVVFNAPDVIMHHDFRLLDLVTLALTYTLTVIPALILAWVDRAFHSLGTTIAGAAIAYLAALIIGFPFLDYGATLMIGLVGAVPAAMCSWLSDKAMRRIVK